MGETPEQIERHIEETRGELERNLNELEGKVRTTFDWRDQFRKNPLILIGAAFAGGLVLSLVIGHTPRNGSESRRTRAHDRGPWDTVKDAFASVWVANLKRAWAR